MASTTPPQQRGVSRRDFLRLAAGTAAAATAAGPALLTAGRAGASLAPGTLKIAKWAHFIPEYDVWFEQVLAKQWGERNDTKVIVDLIPVEEVHARAAAETAAGKGHDLFMFPWPPAEFARHAIDHAVVYQDVSFKHGSIDRLGHRSTFDPKSKRYYAFADSWLPTPIHYFADSWGAVKMPLGPTHYNGLASGGGRIRSQLGAPCGLALTPTLEGNITLNGLLCSFGGSVLDAAGNILINRGSRTQAALKYVKKLVDEAGAAEQLAWGSAANLRAMVARQTSCTVGSIAVLRMAEKENPEAARQMRLSPPLLGVTGIMAFPHATNCSTVWNFADNGAAARQFLVDMIDSSRVIYEQTLGCNFPIFQKTVPNLIVRLENDARGEPPYKYKELKDALHWTTNLGYPGFANPVAMEAFNTFVVPRMFLRVLKGEQNPDEAAHTAEEEVKRIADTWQQA